MALGGSNVSAAAIDVMTIDELAEFSAPTLKGIAEEIEEQAALWKQRLDSLQFALDRKYGEQAKALRLADKKDTGTVNVQDDVLNIKCELSKRVEWAETELQKRWDEVVAAKQDPEIYIKRKVTLSVPEAVYSNWPDNIKEAFDPARTVKTDKPKYTIIDPSVSKKK